MRTLGTNFPTIGPGLSAFIMCIFRAPLNGKNAIMNTNTPIPPTQWVKLRHIKRDFDIAKYPSAKPSPVKMVAPVVEKPDAASNKASMYEGISLENQNGNAPKTEL